jgi:hypothetical protein
MAQQMQCDNCGHLLHLRDIFGTERRYGLASEIPLKCSGCKILQFVHTSKDSNTKELVRDRRARVYDTNTKLALGIYYEFEIASIFYTFIFLTAMIDSGLGATQVNKVLSTLNIPTIGDHSIKRHEELVGEALLKESEDSMDCAIAKEKFLTWYI